jgi:hypothetical protein
MRHHTLGELNPPPCKCRRMRDGRTMLCEAHGLEAVRRMNERDARLSDAERDPQPNRFSGEPL